MFARQMIATVLLLALNLQPACACLWDRDTLESEASDYHDLLTVIAGRFPRNPPSFYESRLARVKKEIAADPDNLALYDDAGVACDRLHRSAEAIGWMEKKAAVLAAHPDKDHQYRYHANLGTFLIHQWLAAGADPEQAEGEQGAEHIRKAIEISPDAHFGREAVQLIAIESLLKVRSAPADPENTAYTLLEIDGYPGEEIPGDLTPEKALKGLSGMVNLGAAWESVDIFSAIAVALSIDQRASLSYLAKLRVKELIADGKESLSPNFPDDPDLVAPDRVARPAHLDTWFELARSNADKWQKQRNAYIEKQIADGKHPDTHPNFWINFDDSIHPLPAFPDNPLTTSQAAARELKNLLYWLLITIALIPVAWFILRKWRNRHELA